MAGRGTTARLALIRIPEAPVCVRCRRVISGEVVIPRGVVVSFAHAGACPTKGRP